MTLGIWLIIVLFVIMFILLYLAHRKIEILEWNVRTLIDASDFQDARLGVIEHAALVEEHRRNKGERRRDKLGRYTRS